MEKFEGTVRTPGDAFELAAVLQIGDGRLIVSAREHELGDWPLEGISARLRPDGCHIFVEGEELIATVPHPSRLVDVISADQTRAGDSPTQTEPAPGLSDAGGDSTLEAVGMFDRLPPSWKLATAVAVLVIILWMFAPTALVGLLLLAATGFLLAGTLGHLDPFTAVRLPDRLTPPRLIGLGVAAVTMALILAISIA